MRTLSKVSLNLNLCLLIRHQASYSQGLPCKPHIHAKFRAEFNRIPTTLIITPESGKSRRQDRKPNSLLLPMTLQHLNYLLPHYFVPSFSPILPNELHCIMCCFLELYFYPTKISIQINHHTCSGFWFFNDPFTLIYLKICK